MQEDRTSITQTSRPTRSLHRPVANVLTSIPSQRFSFPQLGCIHRAYHDMGSHVFSMIQWLPPPSLPPSLSLLCFFCFLFTGFPCSRVDVLHGVNVFFSFPFLFFSECRVAAHEGAGGHARFFASAREHCYGAMPATMTGRMEARETHATTTGSRNGVVGYGIE